MGDLNVNFLSNTRDTCAIEDILDVYNISNIIKVPTCYKATNPTLLDVILTNSPNRVASTLCVDTGISDFHLMTCPSTKFSYPGTIRTDITYRSYKRFDEVKFILDLSSAPFHVAGIFDDIDDAVWFYDKLLSEITDHHAPIKRRKERSNKAPFMNGALRKAINVKRTLRKQAKKYNGAWEVYRVQRNKVTSLRRSSIKKYFRDRCGPSNSESSFWKTIRPFLTDKSKSNNQNSIILLHEGNLIQDAGAVCEIFNDYLANIFTDIPSVSKGMQNQDEHVSVNLIKSKMKDKMTTFDFQTVSEEKVLNSLKKIDPKKATGPDAFPPKLLRAGAEALCPSLTNLINKSIQTSTFPSDMKKKLTLLQFSRKPIL